MQRLTSSEQKQLASSLPRSDLLSDGAQNDAPPTGRFVVTVKRRPKKKSKYNIGTGSNANLNVSASGTSTAVNQTNGTGRQQYRKWGDERFPQRVDERGNVIPIIPFPAIAPEMPPEILAIVQRRAAVT